MLELVYAMLQLRYFIHGTDEEEEEEEKVKKKKSNIITPQC